MTNAVNVNENAAVKAAQKEFNELAENATDEEFSSAKEDLRKQLMTLEEKAPELYKEACEKNLWKK